MDVEADVESFRNNWIASRTLTSAATDDDEAGTTERDIAEAIFERWHDAGRVGELLTPLLEDDDTFIRYIAAHRLLAFDRGAVRPEEAIRTLGEIAAIPGDVGDRARALLAIQMQPVRVKRAAFDRMAAVLQSAGRAGATFNRLGLIQPMQIDAQVGPIVEALGEQERSTVTHSKDPPAEGDHVTISWFLAINVLNVLDALGNGNSLTDRDIKYNGSPIREAAELGEVLFEALKPPSSDLADREPTFILWSADWEIVG